MGDGERIGEGGKGREHCGRSNSESEGFGRLGDHAQSIKYDDIKSVIFLSRQSMLAIVDEEVFSSQLPHLFERTDGRRLTLVPSRKADRAEARAAPLIEGWDKFCCHPIS